MNAKDILFRARIAKAILWVELLAPIRQWYTLPSDSHYNEAGHPFVPEPALHYPDNLAPVCVVEETAYVRAKHPVGLVLLHPDRDRMERIVRPAEYARVHFGQETVQPFRMLASC